MGPPLAWKVEGAGGDCSSWGCPCLGSCGLQPLCAVLGSSTGRGLEKAGSGHREWRPGPGFSLTPSLGGATRSFVLIGPPPPP